jgi:hypothetical protein
MQGSGEAAPTCTYGRFQSIDDLEAMRKRAREMGCRRATYHEDEDAGRQQAFETSLEVSALILLR